MKKRIVSLLMVVAMVISMMPVNAFALTDEGVYEVGDTIWLAEGATPSDLAVAENGTWKQTSGNKAETNLTCGMDEHTHIVGCGTNEDGSWACGQAVHTHGETCAQSGTCVEHAHIAGCATNEDGTWACGQEEHTHGETCTEESTCVEHTHIVGCATNEDGTWACGQEEHTHVVTCAEDGSCVEHSHITGCADCGAVEHTHSDTCYTTVTYYEWIVEETVAPTETTAPVTTTETSAPAGTAAPGDYSINLLVEEAATATTATVTVSSASSGTYVLYNVDTGTYDTVTLSQRGTLTFSDVAEGTYILAKGTHGSSRYTYADVVIGADDLGTTKTVTLSNGSFGSDDDPNIYETAASASIFEARSTFDHVDVRVSGSVTVVGSNGSTVNVDATISNAYLTVTSAGKTVVNNKALSGSSTSKGGQEYRQMGLSLAKASTVVTVNCDVSYTDPITNTTKTIENVVVTFNSATNPDAFIEAIRVCDMVQGLDFHINVSQYIDYYDVWYTWSGIPDGLTSLPTGSNDLVEESTYTVNTTYTQGTTVLDTENGHAYVFSGWEYYVAQSDGTVTELDPANPGTITMQDDYEIVGVWVERDLPEVAAEMTITKTFSGLPEGVQNTENFYISVYAPDGTRYDVDMGNQGSWSNGVWSYTFPVSTSGTYTIAEGNYTYPGYSVNHTVNVDTVTGISSVTNGNYTVTDGSNAWGVQVAIDLPHDASGYTGVAAQADNLSAGSVNFSNAYSKAYGDPIYHWPDLQVRKWNEVGGQLGGAVFALYSDAECNNLVKGDLTTGDTTGSFDIKFEELSQYVVNGTATFYLKEIDAPYGYIANDLVYEIVLTETSSESYDGATNQYHTNYYYTVTVTNTADDTKFVFDSDGNDYQLNVINQPILADLHITKAFEVDGTPIASEDITDDAYIVVDIYGPVVFADDASTITSYGTKYDDITLYASEGWELTLEDLPVGQYLVTEAFASIHGYQWVGVDMNNGEEKTYTIDGAEVTGYVLSVNEADNGTTLELAITNSYTPWTAVDFTIYKETPENNDIPGATFQLFTDKACTTPLVIEGETQVAVTDTYGNLTFDNLKVPAENVSNGVGSITYYLKETKAAEGYYLSSNVYAVTISVENNAYDITITDADGNAISTWNHAVDALTVVNTPILGELTITKDIEGVVASEYPESVVFSVNGPNNYSKVVTLPVNGEWTTTLTGLELGTYTVIEQDASVPGYTLKTTTYQVEGGTATSGTVSTIVLSDTTGGTANNASIPDSADSSVTYTNVYERNERYVVIPTRFNIYKTDAESGAVLGGAVFQLYWDEACSDAVEASEVPEGFTISATTNANGYAAFTGLKLEDRTTYPADSAARTGVFYLKETTAPTGYHVSETVWKITLGEEIKVEALNENTGFFETVVDWVLGIFKPDDTAATEFNGETNTLAVTNQRIKGSIKLNKKFEYSENDAEPSAEVMDTVQIIAHVHGPYAKDAWTEDDFTIADATEDVRLTLTKNGNWEATKSELELGYYLLHEAYTHIPGYNFISSAFNGNYESTVKIGNETYYIVHIASDAEMQLEVTNTYDEWDKVDIEIRKQDEEGNALHGAEFTLYSDNTYTTVVASGTTDSSGILEFGPFDEDATYYLKETAAPDNHYLSDLVWKVEVKAVPDASGNNKYEAKISIDGAESGTDPVWNWNAATDTLTVENKEILGQITVTKEFLGDFKTEEMPTITVGLYGDNGEQRSTTLSTTNTSYTFENLPMGTYTLVETNATVGGYILTTEYYVGGVLQMDGNNVANAATVVLDEGNTNAAPAVSVGIKNTYDRQESLEVSYASFKIKKVDSETGEPLKDAIFQLSNGNGTNLTENTDENGIAEFKNIPLISKEDTPAASDQTYLLTELDAPAGYTKDGTTWEVVLTKNSVKINELSEDKSIFETIYEWIVGAINKDNNNLLVDGVLTVKNTPITGSIAFDKDFNFGEGVTAPDLSELKVKVHVHGPVTFDDNNVVTDMGQTYELELTETGEWKATQGNLPLGQYLVHETFASVHGFNWTGYTLSGNYQKVEREHDGVTYEYYLVPVEENANEGSDPVNIDITNSYEIWDSTDFYIHKVDENGNALAGATFQLYWDAACTDPVELSEVSAGANVSAVTGDDGLAHFQGYKVDADKSVTYYIKEVEAPAHYYANKDIWSVTISHDDESYNQTLAIVTDTADKSEVHAGADEIHVQDLPILADLTIKKSFADEVPQGMGTIILNVTGPNGYVSTVKLDGVVDDIEIEAWTAKLIGLALGEYTITEDITSATVPGYDLTAPDAAAVTFTDSFISDTVQITNDYDKNEATVHNPDSFTLLKKDDNGNILPGAVFALTNAHDVSHVRYFTTGEDGTVLIDNLMGYLDADGKPQSVTYTLQEVDAPYGYYVNSTIWTVTVTEDGGEVKVVLNAEKNVFETIWDWIAGITGTTSGGKWAYDNETDILTVEDETILGELTITKVFTGLDDEHRPESITVTVTGPNGYSEDVVLDGVVDTIETSAWTAELTGLALGEYTVEENTDSAKVGGYDLTGTAYSSETLSLTENDITATVTVTNTYEKNEIPVNNPTSLKILKTDEKGNVLKDAKFRLTDAEGKVTYYTTDENGEVTITGLVGNGTLTSAEGVKYTLQEIDAPYGYYVNATVWTITITADGNVVLNAEDNVFETVWDWIVDSITGVPSDSEWSFTNGVLTVVDETILGELTITKAFTGLDAEHRPESITVTVSGPNGYSKDVVLDAENEWTDKLTGLALGEYTVAEDTATAAVGGYTLESTAYSSESLSLTEDNITATVTVTNTYEKNEIVPETNTTSLKIVKTDEKGNLLKGAKFRLTDADGNVTDYTTDENGEITIDGLRGKATPESAEAVDYILTEIQAPVGYITTNATWTVKVYDVDGKPTITLNHTSNTFESIYDWIVNVTGDTSKTYTFKDNVLTVTNAPTKLTITKVEEWILDGKAVDFADVKDYANKIEGIDRVYDFKVEWTLNGVTESKNVSIDMSKGENAVVIEGIIPEGASYTVTETSTGIYTTGIVYGDDAVNNTYLMDDEAEVTVTNTYELNKWDDHEDPTEPSDPDDPSDPGDPGDPGDPDHPGHKDEDPDKDSGILRLCLDLKKVDGVDGFALAGAWFDVTNVATGKTVALVKSDENGMLGFDILEAGTYTITETITPNGYETMEPIIFHVAETVSLVDDVITIRLVGDLKDFVLENYPKYIDVSVTKKWNYDADEITPPTSVTMTLYRNGVAYDTVKLSKDNKWTHTWSDLPAYATWTVDEANVPEGFYRLVNQVGNNWTITNTASSNHKTGDDFNVAAVASVMGLSVMGLAVLLFLGNKKKRNA